MSDFNVDAWDGKDDKDCSITIKVVPDALTTVPAGAGDTLLHIYQVQVDFAADGPTPQGSMGEDLYNCLEAFNKVCLRVGYVMTTPTPLPSPIASSSLPSLPLILSPLLSSLLWPTATNTNQHTPTHTNTPTLQTGIAVQTALPSTAHTCELFLHDVTLRMTVDYLGAYYVTREDLSCLQRFHKGVFCQEDVDYLHVHEYLPVDTQDVTETPSTQNRAEGRGPEATTDTEATTDMETCADTETNASASPSSLWHDSSASPTSQSESAESADCSAGAPCSGRAGIAGAGSFFVDHPEWAASSGGAWMVIVPVSAEPGFSVDGLNSAYISKCAREAQILAHNLRILSQSEKKSEAIAARLSCARMGTQGLQGLLILANNITLGSVSCCREVKTLTSVMEDRPARGAPSPQLTTRSTPCDTLDPDIPRTQPTSPIPPAVPVTYADHLLEKRQQNDPLRDVIANRLDDPSYLLLAMDQVSTKTFIAPLLAPLPAAQMDKKWLERHSVFSGKTKHNYFMPEQCRPMGRVVWYNLKRLLPTVAYRFQSWVLADEARAALGGLAGKYESGRDCSESRSGKKRGRDDRERDRERDGKIGDGQNAFRSPSIGRMLEAMSPKHALEARDSERLETLGDSFLKFAISVHLFHHKQGANEGSLTRMRSLYVSNKALCKAALDTGLSKYMRLVPLSRGVNNLEFLPPGMAQPADLPHCSVWCTDIMQQKRPSVCWQATDTLFDRLAVRTRRLPVGFKKLADFVEAVIGACFLDAGVQGGISAIKAFGVWPATTPKAGNATAGDAAAGERLGILPTPPIVNREYSGLDKVEENLKYTFRNPALLLQAITHSSLAKGRHNNERLEFLGDAVLDLVVVAHVFRRSASFQPEQLHNEKQLHTNNCNLARVAYELNLGPFIQHDSQTMDESFVKYSAAIKEHKGHVVAVENKTLADTMEAVIGAMFLDCGENLSVIEAFARRRGLLVD
ncbi:hypothetical protein B484DRAFT_454009 [Ochromonadaceae sp. CCMP2298]|nr:hypothetical protein B484DRAFT_454009 [Ochromonadaceae sp. CCMP2298]